jgi:lipoprotein signal peptidase
VLALPRRRLLAALLALVVACIDLTAKLLTVPVVHHARPFGVAVVMVAVGFALLWIVPRVPSVAVALGAGIAAGGVLGNLVSLLAWRSGVPDGIVRGGIAFNLADVSVLLGDALMLSAAALFALRHRTLLRERF